MAAYIIVQVDVQDPEGFENYRKMVPATLEAYGGRFIIRGGRVENLEGDWNPARVVTIEFDDAERAKAWWSSEGYAPAKALRQKTANTMMILVEGV